jgi:hypothetical protein
MDPFPEVLTDENAKERHPDFKKALFELNTENITTENLNHLIRFIQTPRDFLSQ